MGFIMLLFLALRGGAARDPEKEAEVVVEDSEVRVSKCVCVRERK
jgi:hypothetical protein